MIKLDVVSSILDGCKDVVHQLDGLEVDDTESISRKRELAAEANRDLLFLADQLHLAASLVKNEYWHAKGYNETGRVRQQA